jgi:hypothetical protein
MASVLLWQERDREFRAQVTPKVTTASVQGFRSRLSEEVSRQSAPCGRHVLQGKAWHFTSRIILYQLIFLHGELCPSAVSPGDWQSVGGVK